MKSQLHDGETARKYIAMGFGFGSDHALLEHILLRRVAIAAKDWDRAVICSEQIIIQLGGEIPDGWREFEVRRLARIERRPRA